MSEREFPGATRRCRPAFFAPIIFSLHVITIPLFPVYNVLYECIQVQMRMRKRTKTNTKM